MNWTLVILLLLILYTVYIVWLVWQIILDYDSCSPTKTVGWVMAVIFIPVLGLLCYNIVGRNLKKYKSYYQAYRRSYSHLWLCLGDGRAEPSGPSENFRPLETAVEQLSGWKAVHGNALEIYGNAREKFDHLFRDIEEAKEHIHILYYVIGSDEIGNDLKRLIIRKCQQGVAVRILYDEFGCNQTCRSYFEELRRHGADVIVFAPIAFPKFLRRINYRNHKKIVVIDGNIAYTGGINVKDEYIKGVKWGGIWRDTHFRIQGPAVHGFQAVFLADWSYRTERCLMREDFFPEIPVFGHSSMQVLASEPTGEHDNIMEAMVRAITLAKKSVRIETPYFIPTECILSAIEIAAMSGVEVTLIVPKRSDSRTVQYATHSYISELLCYGVKVYLYRPGFIHSKLMIIDDEVVIGGSSNMDVRSFQLNFECNMFVYDPEFAVGAVRLYESDILDSEPVDSQAWENRGKREKTLEAFFRLMSPVL